MRFWLGWGGAWGWAQTYVTRALEAKEPTNDRLVDSSVDVPELLVRLQEKLTDSEPHFSCSLLQFVAVNPDRIGIGGGTESSEDSGRPRPKGE